MFWGKRFEGLDNLALPGCIVAGASTANPMLDITPGQLDGREIRRVGRQIEQGTSGCLYERFYLPAVMDAGIVQHQHRTCGKAGKELLLEEGFDIGALEGTQLLHRCLYPRKGEGAQHRAVGPALKRDGFLATFLFERPAVETVQREREA